MITFLDRLAQEDAPPTAAEAEAGGVLVVRPLDGGERFGVFGVLEDPERGDEPFAIFAGRSAALLGLFG